MGRIDSIVTGGYTGGYGAWPFARHVSGIEGGEGMEGMEGMEGIMGQVELNCCR